MEDVTTKILTLKLDYKDTVNGIFEYEKAIAQAKQAQKEMREAVDNGEISQEEYSKRMIESRAEITRYQKEMRSLQSALDQQIKAERMESGSLEQLRAQLSALTKQYDNLSAVERESDTGKQLQDQINAVTDALKEGEEETQRYYRNVGNYTKSMQEAFKGLDDSLDALKKEYAQVAAAEGATSKNAEKLRKEIQAQEQAINETKNAATKLYSSVFPFATQLLPILEGGLKGIKTWLTTAAQGVKMLSKQFLALLANPIIAALAAIAAAIGLVVAGLKGSEENSDKLTRVLAPLKVALGGLQTILETVCGWILSAVEYAGKLAAILGKVAEALPVVGGAAKAVNEAVANSIALEERDIQLKKDKRALLVEEAKIERDVAEARDIATDATNSYTERITALQKAIAAETKIAETRVKLAREEYAIAVEKAKQAPNSEEDNRRLAELEANVLKAETTLYQQRGTLNKQLNSLVDQERKANETAAKERAEQAKARAEAVKAAVQKEVEAVRAAEDAMNALIKDNDEKRRATINTQYNREIDALKKRLETETDLTATAQDAITQTIAAKEMERAEQLAAIDAEVQQRKLEAEKQALEEEKNLREQYAKEELQRIQNDFTEKMMQAADNEVTQAQLEVEQRLQSLEMLHQAEGESEQEYRARQLQAQEDYTNAKKRLADTEVKVQQAKFEMLSALSGGFAKALSALGEENKAFAKLSKVLALGEIAINTGKAIAAGTAQAQSVPYPANLVAMATTIATVLANVASAITQVKSAKFATGAVNIQGAGSGTSDSIYARISTGESVMNAAATALFASELQAMNEIGASATPQLGGVTMNNAEPATMAEGLRSVIAELRPVVSVVDINHGQQRVEVVERAATM